MEICFMQRIVMFFPLGISKRDNLTHVLSLWATWFKDLILLKLVGFKPTTSTLVASGIIPTRRLQAFYKCMLIRPVLDMECEIKVKVTTSCIVRSLGLFGSKIIRALQRERKQKSHLIEIWNLTIWNCHFRRSLYAGNVFGSPRKFLTSLKFTISSWKRFWYSSYASACFRL